MVGEKVFILGGDNGFLEMGRNGRDGDSVDATQNEKNFPFVVKNFRWDMEAYLFQGFWKHGQLFWNQKDGENADADKNQKKAKEKVKYGSYKILHELGNSGGIRKTDPASDGRILGQETQR